MKRWKEFIGVDAVTIVLVILSVILQPATQAREPQERAAAVISPEILPDHRVTFRIAAPKANQVELTGNWPDGKATPMTKDGNGMWSVTVGPLKAEIWEYAFVVDGVRTLDPQNLVMARDSDKRNSIVLIPGAESAAYEIGNVPHGSVSAVWYSSPTLRLTRRMFVYTPPGYETSSSSDRYPVLYLLHGWGGDEEEWTVLGRSAQVLDNLISQGKAKPMIVVMPNGHPNEAAAADVFSPLDPSLLPIPRASPDVLDAHITQISDSLINDVIPFVEKTFRVKSNRENRAVAGLSMGGGQAVYVGLNHLDQFSWIASFSGAFILWPRAMVQPLPTQGSSAPNVRNFQPGLNLEAVPKNFPGLDAKANPRIRLFYISCGTEDGLIKSNREFKDWLKSHGIHFVDVETPGYAHVWSYWRVSLLDLAPRLFTPAPQ